MLRTCDTEAFAGFTGFDLPRWHNFSEFYDFAAQCLTSNFCDNLHDAISQFCNLD